MAPSPEILRAIAQSPLPVFLGDLPSRSIVAANAAGLQLLDVDDSDLPSPVLEHTPDREAVEARLDMLEAGALHGYATTWRVTRSDGTRTDVAAWVRRVPAEPNVILVVTTPEGAGVDLQGPGAVADGDIMDVAIGTLDDEWRITMVSDELEDVLGWTPAEAAMSPLHGSIHPADLGTLVVAIARLTEDRPSGVAVSVRLAHKTEGWRLCRVAFLTSDGGGGFTIVISAPPREREVVTTDERNVWRLALEQQASGLLAALGDRPSGDGIGLLGDLSARQLEIVTRLLRGERVPGIARSLYVSQSTVRNHLAALFRKYDVHSQEALVALLRDG